MLKGYGWRVAALVGVPVVTLVAMTWDRLVHNVTSSPQAWETNLANIIWFGSAFLLLLTPVFWSRHDASARAVGSAGVEFGLVFTVAVYSVGVFGFDWPRWPQVLNSDLEVVGITYVVSAIVVGFATFRWLSMRRSGASHSGTNLAVAIFATCVALSSSAALVFFE
jgi:hypothetical protein